MEKPKYHERLSFLKIHSLETRRLENDEINLRKNIHDQIDSNLKDKLSYHHPQRSTRQHRTFYTPNFITKIAINSPLNRIQLPHYQHFEGIDIINDAFHPFKNKVINEFTF